MHVTITSSLFPYSWLGVLEKSHLLIMKPFNYRIRNTLFGQICAWNATSDMQLW